ncbi:MAG: heparinase II/III family protein, partial [Pyrinomonadaceae bacterium]
VLRGERSYGFTRCTTFHHRPAQADMLHLDLWWHGVNIACDPGTYLYYADSPWNNSLVGTSVHNTLSVAGNDQMVRGPRFMWFDWVKSDVLSFKRSSDGNLEWFQGQHYGYSRLKVRVIHRRAVLRAGDDVWLVVDDVFGEGSPGLAVHWLLHPGEYVLDQQRSRLALSLPVDKLQFCWSAWGLDENEVDISCGDDTKAPRGWRSPHYGLREPALSFQLSGQANLPCRLVSVFSLGEEDREVSFSKEAIEITTIGSTVAVSLFDLPSSPLSIKRAQLSHRESVVDELVGDFGKP